LCWVHDERKYYVDDDLCRETFRVYITFPNTVVSVAQAGGSKFLHSRNKIVNLSRFMYKCKRSQCVVWAEYHELLSGGNAQKCEYNRP